MLAVDKVMTGYKLKLSRAARRIRRVGRDGGKRDIDN